MYGVLGVSVYSFVGGLFVEEVVVVLLFFLTIFVHFLGVFRFVCCNKITVTIFQRGVSYYFIPRTCIEEVGNSLKTIFMPP